MPSIPGKYQHYKNENFDEYFSAVGCKFLLRKSPNLPQPSIPIKYQHYKNENFDEYFSAVGVPYMPRKMMAMSSPLMEITLTGDMMTIKNSSLLRTTEHTFKLGEEYDEKMPNTTIKSTTTIKNDYELVTNSIIPETGEKCARHYLFTDEECVIKLTHDKAKTPAKRYFRKVL